MLGGMKLMTRLPLPGVHIQARLLRPVFNPDS
jgi:hypothetical protein